MFGVRLTVVGDGMEAAVICGLLRTGGPREILVSPGDLERARELIKAGLA